MFRKRLSSYEGAEEESFRALVLKKDTVEDIIGEDLMNSERIKSKGNSSMENKIYYSSEGIHDQADEFGNGDINMKSPRPESIKEYQLGGYKNETPKRKSGEILQNIGLKLPPDLFRKTSRSNSNISPESAKNLQLEMMARSPYYLSGSKNNLEENGSLGFMPLTPFNRINSESELNTPSRKKLNGMSVRNLRKKITGMFKHRKSVFQPDIEGLNFGDISKLVNQSEFRKYNTVPQKGIPGLIMARHMDFLKEETRKDNITTPWFKTVLYIFSDFVQAMLALFSCVIYILSTYFLTEDELADQDHGKSMVKFLHTSEYVITGVSCADLLRHFIESKHKMKFFFHIHNILDMMTIMPVFLQLIMKKSSSGLGFLHIMQIFRIIRILRLYRLFKEYDSDNTEKHDSALNESRFSIQRQISIFICSIAACLFIAAGISYELDKIFIDTYAVTEYSNIEDPFNTTDFSFFSGLYLMFQTITTLGFGDIIPITASSRLFLILVIIMLLLLIFDQSFKLSEIISKTTKYDFEFHRGDHVVFMGEINHSSLVQIMSEIFKQKSSFLDFKNILIVKNQPPAAEVIQLRDLQMFQDKLFYLQTNVLLESMIRKTNLKQAKAIYVLTDYTLKNNAQQDNLNELLLRILQDEFPFTPKIIQFNDPNIMYSQNNELFRRNPYNTIISLDALKLSLMVESCFNPGIGTVICNLFTPNKIIPSFKNSNNVTWYMEYGISLTQELYTIKLSSAYVGKSFLDIQKSIQRQRILSNAQVENVQKDFSESFLLLGIQTPNLKRPNDFITLINPLEYTIKHDDCAIVIATSREKANILTENHSEEFMLKLNKLVKEPKENYLNLINNSLAAKDGHEGDIHKFHLSMWRDDLRKKISGHLMIFCSASQMNNIARELRTRSKKPICFFQPASPDEYWLKMKTLYKKIYYLEGETLNIEHLRNANLDNSHHVLIFSNDPTATIEKGSESCLLANLLEEYFNCRYTIEVLDNQELRFLSHKPKNTFNQLGHQFYPHYLAGSVIYNPQFEAFLGCLIKGNLALEVFKSIFYDQNKDISDHQTDTLNEHKNLFTIDVPIGMTGKKYIDFIECINEIDPAIIPIALVTMRYNKNFRSASQNAKGRGRKTIILNSSIDELLDAELNPDIIAKPLVLTNPLLTMILEKDDKIICMGRKNYRRFSSSLDPNRNFGMINFDLIEDEGYEEDTDYLVQLLRKSLSSKREISNSIQDKHDLVEKLISEIEIKKEILRDILNSQFNEIKEEENDEDKE